LSPAKDVAFAGCTGSRPIDHVIYVHGLFMNGADGLILRRRVEHHLGVRTHAFHYRSVSGSMSDIARRLAEFARGLNGEQVHFVGHSLGGLVIYRTLEQCADLPPGRVVFLGTPSVASRAALGVTERLQWGAKVLGRCVREELLTERTRRWQLARQLGIIAGTRPMGLGQLFARLDGDNDGTISVNEARLAGATDFITQPVSHSGLVLSARVARQTVAFLRDGRFSLG
jgi:pimeloyl-ACP methyl ester carboxylesterase